MAYSEVLAERVRAVLHHTRQVEEKKMFGGLAFMLNGKLCVTVGPHRIMVRIDPRRHHSLVRRKGVRTVTMGGRQYIGYVHVEEESVKTDRQLDFWVRLARDFHRRTRVRQSVKSK